MALGSASGDRGLRLRVLFYRIALQGLGAFFVGLGLYLGLLGAAARPRFVDPATLPAIDVERLLLGARVSVIAALVVGLGIAILVDVALTPGVIAVFCAERQPVDAERARAALPSLPRRSLRLVLDAGRRFRGPFLRLLALSLTSVGLIGFALVRVSGRLEVYALRGHLGGVSRFVVLPSLLFALGLVLIAVVGAVTLLARVLVVVDGRARAIHAARLALRISLGRPGFLALYCASSVSLFVVDLALVTLVRIPWGPLPSVALRLFVLALVLGAQAASWRYLVERAIDVVLDPRFNGLRAKSPPTFAALRRFWLDRRAGLAQNEALLASTEPRGATDAPAPPLPETEVPSQLSGEMP